MDRALSSKEKYSKQFVRMGWGLLVILGLGLIYYIAGQVLTTKAHPDDFILSTVEIGDIESSFNAQGQIIPEREVSINAPITTEIQKVFQSIGDKVKTGEPIIQLNNEFLRLGYESEKDNLLLKKNNIEQSSFQFDKKVKDLIHDSQIFALRIQEQQADLNNLKVLDKMGAGTKENIHKKEIALRITQLEKKKIDDELNFQKQYNQIEKKNLQLKVRINEKELRKLKTKLLNTTLSSPINGVIMWVNQSIGKQVHEGENIARIADLSSFKIAANCSDRYASQIALNTKVRFQTSNTNITGKIINIEPVVQDNTIKFDVQLDHPKQKNLHAYTKGELRVITGTAKQTKRIARGIGIKGGRQQEIFVIRGDQAIKVNVEIGAANSKYVEIISDQIQIGDQVIVSDMKEYRYKTKIDLDYE